MRVKSLHVYPVKGGRGVNLAAAHAALRGFENDRRWIVTDGDDVFLTQRTCPSLAQLCATPANGGLRLEIDGAGEIDVPAPSAGERRLVTVWSDRVNTLAADEAASNWLSKAFARQVRLYYMDAKAERLTSKKWGTPAPVSFADAYPILITTTASLDALNAEMAQTGGAPAGIERFRPNIVIDGARPWSEDTWRKIKIGDVEIDLVKPCDRCVVTTKDQSTGESLGKEPLKTLSIIRQSAHPDLNGVLFGWNASLRNEGVISVGDNVEVIEERPEGWPLASH